MIVFLVNISDDRASDAALHGKTFAHSFLDFTLILKAAS